MHFGAASHVTCYNGDNLGNALEEEVLNPLITIIKHLHKIHQISLTYEHSRVINYC